MADADGNEKGCCEKFSDGVAGFFNFLYNKESGLVLGRTGKSWAKIGFFYLIFYGFLAGFFSGMLAVFLTTLNDPDTGAGPKLTQFVENQPGLTRIGKLGTLGYNKTAGSNDIEGYVESVKQFVEKFDKSPKCKDAPKNSSEGGMPENTDCYFDTAKLKECQPSQLAKTMENDFPCIYIRMNKVYGWVPKSNDGNGYLKLKCIEEGVKVFPEGGFQISGFPFRGQNKFELPFVAVKFNRTQHSEVRCYLEGKDIKLSESYVPYRAYGRIKID